MLEKFPSGQNRKKILAHNSYEIAAFQENSIEARRRKYSWLDSGLESDDKNHRGVTQMSFQMSFENLFRKGKTMEDFSLKEYIENALREKKGNAIGVEFGGVGTNLFSGFTKGFFKKSFSITLIDHRLETEKLEAMVKLKNHKTIEGDIFLNETYQELNKLLKGKKADLIIERMGGGLEFVPPEPYTVAKVLNKWYQVLGDKGLMIIQTPVVFNKVLEKWGEEIKKEYRQKIDFEYFNGESNGGLLTSHSAFRLQKLEGAPKELPYLDPRTLSEIPKTQDYWS